MSFDLFNSDVQEVSMVTVVKKAVNQPRLQGLAQVKLLCISTVIYTRLHVFLQRRRVSRVSYDTLPT